MEDLKFVLRVIASIRDMSLDVELRIKDIVERYRTLLVYAIEVCILILLNFGWIRLLYHNYRFSDVLIQTNRIVVMVNLLVIHECVQFDVSLANLRI